MTRLELLTLIVGRARTNGFELRRWYTARLGLPWISAEASLALLDTQRRYYALLFSHEFAQAFWKPGTEIIFEVPSQTFQRTMPDGSAATVTRKSFLRRTLRKDVWRYHLRQMALAEEPLRYLRKYLRVEEDLDEQTPQASAATRQAPPVDRPGGRIPAKRTARPLPTELPAFLRRPYP